MSKENTHSKSTEFCALHKLGHQHPESDLSLSSNCLSLRLPYPSFKFDSRLAHKLCPLTVVPLFREANHRHTGKMPSPKECTWNILLKFKSGGEHLCLVFCQAIHLVQVTVTVDLGEFRNWPMVVQDSSTD